MNTVEKRDYIHSHLHIANESTLNEFNEKLRKDDILKTKLKNRAIKSEEDIREGGVFTREELENN